MVLAIFRRIAKSVDFVLDYTLEENMILEVYNQQPFSKSGILNKSVIRKYASEILKSFDVRSGRGPPSMKPIIVRRQSAEGYYWPGN